MNKTNIFNDILNLYNDIDRIYLEIDQILNNTFNFSWYRLLKAKNSELVKTFEKINEKLKLIDNDKMSLKI